MTDLVRRSPPDTAAAFGGGVLSPALRRDLTDLNARYLELGLMPGSDGDPRFGWFEPVRALLLAVDADTRARIAAVPFALFDLVLPIPGATAGVEDGEMSHLPAAWQGQCASFAHQVILLARQLAGTEPLALRLVLGLGEDVQRWLAECRLAQLADLAASPRTIRPRWRWHARFWEMLANAARSDTAVARQWAHCAGLCLLGSTEGGLAQAPSRGRPRR